MNEDEIFDGMTVSFDVTLEEVGRSGAPRLRASRVRQEENQVEIQRISTKRSNNNNDNNSNKIVIKDKNNNNLCG